MIGRDKSLHVYLTGGPEHGSGRELWHHGEWKVENVDSVTGKVSLDPALPIP